MTIAAPSRAFPKTLGACVDRLYELREKRLKQAKTVEALEREEKELKEHLIQNISKADSSGVAGKKAKVTIHTKAQPSVKDWDAFYKYISRHKAYELLQRRVNATAVAERWEAGKELPGVEKFNVVSVSLTKL